MRLALVLALFLPWLCACPRIKELEGAVAERDAQIAALSAEVDDRDGRIAAHEARIAGLEADKTRLEAQVAQQAADLGRAEALLAEEREKGARMLADRGALRQEVANMREALEDLEARKRAAEARVAEFRDLVKRFRSLIDAGTLEVKIIDGRMVVALATDVLFASGSARLSEEGKVALAEVASVLSGLPDRRFQVEGHTDDVPIASEKYPSNWYLASGRAIGVVEHLVASGMRPDQVSAASFGEFRPVVPNDGKENKARNRRIEIVVVPDLSEMPGYEELQEL